MEIPFATVSSELDDSRTLCFFVCLFLERFVELVRRVVAGKSEWRRQRKVKGESVRKMERELFRTITSVFTSELASFVTDQKVVILIVQSTKGPREIKKSLTFRFCLKTPYAS